MNIIFGRENAAALDAKYTLLELDTIQIGDTGPAVTVFCAIDSIPILDMPRVENMKTLHENLMIEYRKRNWNYCEQAMEHLRGFWNHDLDTFYDSLTERIETAKTTEPTDNWWVVVKYPS